MAGSAPVDFIPVDRADAYGFARRVLVRSRYVRLSRPDKGLIRRFLIKVTGFSRAQVSRLISQYRETGRIEDRRRRYSKADIGLLAEVDETLGGLCGAVTRRLMQRQYEVFGDARFERLAGLSNSHLYRLRQSVTYRRRRLAVTRTRATQVSIGERRKPHPAGRAGFLRGDSVHQGDLDGEKGLYEIWPCHFPVEIKDAKGKKRKTYPFDKVTTPYPKFKSLDAAAQYLRPGVTFEQLDREALAIDDLAAARTVTEALVALFAEIRRRDATVA